MSNYDSDVYVIMSIYVLYLFYVKLYLNFMYKSINKPFKMYQTTCLIWAIIKAMETRSIKL